MLINGIGEKGSLITKHTITEELDPIKMAIISNYISGMNVEKWLADYTIPTTDVIEGDRIIFNIPDGDPSCPPVDCSTNSSPIDEETGIFTIGTQFIYDFYESIRGNPFMPNNIFTIKMATDLEVEITYNQTGQFKVKETLPHCKPVLKSSNSYRRWTNTAIDFKAIVEQRMLYDTQYDKEQKNHGDTIMMLDPEKYLKIDDMILIAGSGYTYIDTRDKCGIDTCWYEGGGVNLTALSYLERESRKIKDIIPGGDGITTIKLDKPLKYFHWGGTTIIKRKNRTCTESLENHGGKAGFYFDYYNTEIDFPIWFNGNSGLDWDFMGHYINLSSAIDSTYQFSLVHEGSRIWNPLADEGSQPTTKKGGVYYSGVPVRYPKMPDPYRDTSIFKDNTYPYRTGWCHNWVAPKGIDWDSSLGEESNMGNGIKGFVFPMLKSNPIQSKGTIGSCAKFTNGTIGSTNWNYAPDSGYSDENCNRGEGSFKVPYDGFYHIKISPKFGISTLTNPGGVPIIEYGVGGLCDQPLMEATQGTTPKLPWQRDPPKGKQEAWSNINMQKSMPWEAHLGHLGSQGPLPWGLVRPSNERAPLKGYNWTTDFSISKFGETLPIAGQYVGQNVQNRLDAQREWWQYLYKGEWIKPMCFIDPQRSNQAFVGNWDTSATAYMSPTDPAQNIDNSTTGGGAETTTNIHGWNNAGNLGARYYTSGELVFFTSTSGITICEGSQMVITYLGPSNDIGPIPQSQGSYEPSNSQIQGKGCTSTANLKWCMPQGYSDVIAPADFKLPIPAYPYYPVSCKTSTNNSAWRDSTGTWTKGPSDTDFVKAGGYKICLRCNSSSNVQSYPYN